jgi:hypothetical protein
MQDAPNDPMVELRKFVQDAVDDHWKRTGTALLLTTLGQEVKAELPHAGPLLVDGLKRFLERNAVVQLVEHPSTPVKVGAVPLHVAIPSDASRLFGRSASRNPPHLARSFWRAFHTPISGRRVVVMTPQRDRFIRVEDIGAHDPVPDSAVEIPPSDLSLDDTKPMPEKVASNWAKIRGWIARNGLALSAFEEAGSVPPRSSHSSPSLIEAFERLDPQDQARIFVPLDLVMKILSGR